MEGTIIYWTLYIIVSYLCLKDASYKSYLNINGLEKIDGELVQTSYPEHYFPTLIEGFYFVLSILCIIIIYFVTAFGLELLGIAEQFNVRTGLNEIISIFKI